MTSSNSTSARRKNTPASAPKNHKQVNSKEQLKIASVVEKSMSYFVNCLTEVKKEYRTLACDLIEINKKIDSRRESLRQFTPSVTQQDREDFKALCLESNGIPTEAKLKLTGNAQKIAETYYKTQLKGSKSYL